MIRRSLIFDGACSPSRARKSAAVVGDAISEKSGRNGAACIASPGWSGRGMADNDDTNICDFCRRGRVSKSTQEIRFYQWSDKGYLSCSATIPSGVCDRCGMKSWDDASEAIIEDAVRRAYNERP